LVRRQRTGEGAFIDVASSDCNLATSWLATVTNLNYDKLTDLTGMAPRGVANEGWPGRLGTLFALRSERRALHDVRRDRAEILV
jgi:crotonobetainyl-CoA:carnitine CoA-transferase CaiB-like acyl-CoA transferase